MDADRTWKWKGTAPVREWKRMEEYKHAFWIVADAASMAGSETLGVENSEFSFIFGSVCT